MFCLFVTSSGISEQFSFVMWTFRWWMIFQVLQIRERFLTLVTVENFFCCKYLVALQQLTLRKLFLASLALECLVVNSFVSHHILYQFWMNYNFALNSFRELSSCGFTSSTCLRLICHLLKCCRIVRCCHKFSFDTLFQAFWANKRHQSFRYPTLKKMCLNGRPLSGKFWRNFIKFLCSNNRSLRYYTLLPPSPFSSQGSKYLLDN